MTDQEEFRIICLEFAFKFSDQPDQFLRIAGNIYKWITEVEERPTQDPNLIEKKNTTWET